MLVIAEYKFRFRWQLGNEKRDITSEERTINQTWKIQKYTDLDIARKNKTGLFTFYYLSFILSNRFNKMSTRRKYYLH